MDGMHAGSVPFPRLETPTAELDFAPAAASPYPTAGVAREGPDQLLVRCSHYTSLPEVCDSDHKPVVARLRADVPSTDHKRRRRHVGKILSDFHAEVTSSLVRLRPRPSVSPPVMLAVQVWRAVCRRLRPGSAAGRRDIRMFSCALAEIVEAVRDLI